MNERKDKKQRPASFRISIPFLEKLKSKKQKNEHEKEEEWRAYVKKKDEIAFNEIQRRAAVRKQATGLIQNHIQNGLDLSEVRSFYINNATDLVNQKPYDYYSRYTREKNQEPMSQEEWAKNAVVEIFVNDLIPKLLQDCTFQKSENLN